MVERRGLKIVLAVDGSNHSAAAVTLTAGIRWPANYLDPYMSRRDPNCLIIGDDLPSEKPRFRDSFQTEYGDCSVICSWLEEKNRLPKQNAIIVQ